MTRDEAVRTLQSMKSYFPLPKAAQTRRTQNEALDVAIEALKAEPCDDTISRQAAIEALLEKGQRSKRYRLGDIWELNFDEIREAIAAVPSAQSEQRWIPVTERLPEKKEKRYWICTDTGYQCQCRWTNDCYGFGPSESWKWKIIDIPQYAKVAAWMPLPEPYKEEKKK